MTNNRTVIQLFAAVVVKCDWPDLNMGRPLSKCSLWSSVLPQLARFCRRRQLYESTMLEINEKK